MPQDFVVAFLNSGHSDMNANGIGGGSEQAIKKHPAHIRQFHRQVPRFKRSMDHRTCPVSSSMKQRSQENSATVRPGLASNIVCNSDSLDTLVFAITSSLLKYYESLANYL